MTQRHLYSLLPEGLCEPSTKMIGDTGLPSDAAWFFTNIKLSAFLPATTGVKLS